MKNISKEVLESLCQKTETLPISRRLRNVLSGARINTIFDSVVFEESKLVTLRNFGSKKMAELNSLWKQHNLNQEIREEIRAFYLQNYDTKNISANWAFGGCDTWEEIKNILNKSGVHVITEETSVHEIKCGLMATNNKKWMIEKIPQEIQQEFIEMMETPLKALRVHYRYIPTEWFKREVLKTLET